MVVGVFEGKKNGMKQQLAKVVDSVAENGSDTQIVSTLLSGQWSEIGVDVDTCEVEQCCAVVRSKVGVGLEIVGLDVIVGGIDDRV